MSTAEAIIPELSIVMPCLNEAQTVGECIRKAQHFLTHSGIAGEIVVGDNGSTDGSQDIARSLGARVINVPERGYGSALAGAIAAAHGTFVIMGDADDSYDFSRLETFVTRLRQGDDLVVGNRFVGGIAPGAMPAMHRYFGTPIMTAIGRLFFRSPSRDFWCGLRGFRREAILTLDLRTTGMEFALEMIVKASLYGMRVSEVPTTLSADGRDRPPHLRRWRDGWRGLRFLLLYSPRWLFLVPGSVLMAAGVAGMVALIPGPLFVGRVGFDVHTLLYASMAVLIGFQAVTFAAFTKMFAISEGLLPPDPRMDRLFRYVTLEIGLMVGAGLILAGIAGTLTALDFWSRRAFGPLNPFQVLRIVLPAATTLTLGCEIVLASFFLSVLGLRRR